MTQNIFSLDFTEHALKRLDILIGTEKAKNEIRFMHQFLLAGSYSITWYHGIDLKDIALFAERCASFDIRFLGCETHMDSPYPLYVFSWEDFPTHGSEWYLPAITELKSNNILDHIITTIDVPESVLKKYLS